jgi:hypothetical protein
MARGPIKKRIPFFTDEEQLQRIDAWRRVQEDLPSRAEAIRRLIDAALEAGLGADRTN